MPRWIEFQFLLKNPYQQIAKGSVVKVNDEKMIIKRIDSIVLLNEAVKEPNTVHVTARGIKSNLKGE